MAEWCGVILRFIISLQPNFQPESTGEPLLEFFDTEYLQFSGMPLFQLMFLQLFLPVTEV
jgi:hypothetical protein